MGDNEAIGEVAEGDELERPAEGVVPGGSGGVEELSTGLKLVIGAKDVEEIWALGEDHEAQKELLASKLDNLVDSDPATTFKTDLIVDFHVHNMSHCKTICLNARKTAVFHAIMTQVLDCMKRKSAGIARPGESYTSVEAFVEYQQLMIRHAKNQPPDQLMVFLGSEGRLLTDYVSLTFFKHYLLYQYCLIFPREVETLRVDVAVEAPMPPPPLRKAKLLPDQQKEESQAGSKEASAPFRAGGGGGPPPQEDGLDRTQLPPAADNESGLDPAVEALIDRKVAEIDKKLDGKLQERETRFTQSLQDLKR